MAWATSGSVVLEHRDLSDAAAIGGRGLAVPEIAGLRPQIVCPGDVVNSDPGTLRGRGVVQRSDGKLVATTTGVVERVNKLLYVRPLKHRYVGEVGDVVVGRVVELQAERWVLELGTALTATLHLGAIQLPGNVQRLRTEQDKLRMREFFVENDLISAEIQRTHESGELALQTRNARYGKLQNGVLVTVPSVYVRRQSSHLVTLAEIGVQVILGNNGWIWVCAPPKVVGSGRQETLNFSQMDVRYEPVGENLRERICRVRGAVLALAAHGLEITPDSIQALYDRSKDLGLATWQMGDPVLVAKSSLIESLVEQAMGSSRKRVRDPSRDGGDDEDENGNE